MSKDNQLAVLWLVYAAISLALAVTGQTLIFVGLGIAMLLTTRLRHRWFIYHA